MVVWYERVSDCPITTQSMSTSSQHLYGIVVFFSTIVSFHGPLSIWSRLVAAECGRRPEVYHHITSKSPYGADEIGSPLFQSSSSMLNGIQLSYGPSAREALWGRSQYKVKHRYTCQHPHTLSTTQSLIVEASTACSWVLPPLPPLPPLSVSIDWGELPDMTPHVSSPQTRRRSLEWESPDSFNIQTARTSDSSVPYFACASETVFLSRSNTAYADLRNGSPSTSPLEIVNAHSVSPS